MALFGRLDAMPPKSPILSRSPRSLGPDGDDVVARLCSLWPRALQSRRLARPAQRTAQRGQTELSADVETVERSPVLPFAATHRLQRVQPNNVLTATRSSEPVADPSTALALVAAQRRSNPQARRRPLPPCALHRCVRMQPAAPGLRVTAEDASHLRLPPVDGGCLDWAAATASPDPSSQGPGESHVAD